ncbi:MAG: hypothetical protein EXR29_10935 [Betaproteobacteria bacterium]|nr:hypothetical protein [Betaproteobacteria bacterium]
MIDIARLRRLHIASAITVKTPSPGTSLATFVDSKRRTIAPKDPDVVIALTRLAQNYPSTVALHDVIGAGGSAGSDVERGVAQAIIRLLGTERATISTLPLKVGNAGALLPRAWSLTRVEALSEQPWVTGQHHVGVALSPAARCLLPHLDGQHDRDALRHVLDAALQRGEIPSDPTKTQGSAALGSSSNVDETLAFLARNGVLEA